MTQTSQILKIEMPWPFETALYDEVRQKLSNLRRQGPITDCLLGMNAVAYRYRAMHEAQREFAGSFSVAGPRAPTEERFIQEKALVHFFVNATSCLESFCFALYCLGVELRPEEFPDGDEALRQVKPRLVTDRFTAAWRSALLSQTLREFTTSNAWADLKEFRIMLFHRNHPTRLFTYPEGDLTRPVARVLPGYVSVDTQHAAFPMELDLGFFVARRRWVDLTLKTLLSDLRTFLTETPSIGSAAGRR